MKAVLLWYPSNVHVNETWPEDGYSSQEAIESERFTDEEKARISDILDQLKSVPELLTY